MSDPDFLRQLAGIGAIFIFGYIAYAVMRWHDCVGKRKRAERMGKTVDVDRLPPCDICSTMGHSKLAEYDGKTISGSWAYMCPSCWNDFGIGLLGTGKGQRLVLKK